MPEQTPGATLTTAVLCQAIKDAIMQVDRLAVDATESITDIDPKIDTIIVNSVMAHCNKGEKK